MTAVGGGHARVRVVWQDSETKTNRSEGRKEEHNIHRQVDAAKRRAPAIGR